MTTRQVLYLALVLLLVACQNETTEPPQAPGEKAPQAAAASQPPAPPADHRGLPGRAENQSLPAGRGFSTRTRQ